MDVMRDGSGLRPLYPESEYEWVTHEAVISKDEVAIAIMGHRKIPGTNKEVEAGYDCWWCEPGQEAAWDHRVQEKNQQDLQSLIFVQEKWRSLGKQKQAVVSGM
jgi:hypothetical protein